MNRRKGSLFSDEPFCWECGTTLDLHQHHVYGGHGRRRISDREGCWVWLCAEHHNMSEHSVHKDKNRMDYFRRECQLRWMRREGLSGEEGEDAFRKLFGASYL